MGNVGHQRLDCCHGFTASHRGVNWPDQWGNAAKPHWIGSPCRVENIIRNCDCFSRSLFELLLAEALACGVVAGILSSRSMCRGFGHAECGGHKATVNARPMDRVCA